MIIKEAREAGTNKNMRGPTPNRTYFAHEVEDPKILSKIGISNKHNLNPSLLKKGNLVGGFLVQPDASELELVSDYFIYDVQNREANARYLQFYIHNCIV